MAARWSGTSISCCGFPRATAVLASRKHICSWNISSVSWSTKSFSPPNSIGTFTFMARKTFRPLDFSKARTYPVKKRLSKVQFSLFGKKVQRGARVRSFLEGLPDILAAQNLKAVARKIAQVHRAKKTILLGMGAHPVKVGLSPLIIDFMEKGIVNAVALNGAAVGRAILQGKLPHRRLSIVATGTRLGIPVTSHIAIGTDIIHMHPQADG